MSKKENSELLEQLMERFSDVGGSMYEFHEKYDISSMGIVNVIEAYKYEIDVALKKKKEEEK